MLANFTQCRKLKFDIKGRKCIPSGNKLRCKGINLHDSKNVLFEIEI